jgi:hypothetical protein
MRIFGVYLGLSRWDQTTIYAATKRILSRLFENWMTRSGDYIWWR